MYQNYMKKMSKEDVYAQAQADLRWDNYMKKVARHNNNRQVLKDMVISTIVALLITTDWDYVIDNILKALGM